MIQEQSTDKKLVFGVDFEKKKHIQTPKPKKLCVFQVLKELRSQGPYVYIMGSSQCEGEALANGWCSEHQHAQVGMDEGKRLGYRNVEIVEAFTVIGSGEENWLAYFERVRGSGLKKVLDYLRKQC